MSINKKPNNKTKHSKQTQHIRCVKPNNSKKQKKMLNTIVYLRPKVIHLL